MDLFDGELGKLTASCGSASTHSVEDLASWIENAVGHVAVAVQGERATAGCHMSVWRKRGSRLLWYIECDAVTQYIAEDTIQPDPTLYFGLDVSLARTEKAPSLLAKHVIDAELKDEAMTYGFINPTLWRCVGGPSFYKCGVVAFGGSPSWEQLVEQYSWNRFQGAPGERAREVFWANLYGAHMARHLCEHGLEDAIAAGLSGTEGHGILQYGETGAMAVLLSKDPVRFARRRFGGENALCPAFHGMRQEVAMAAILRRSLAKAGYL